MVMGAAVVHDEIKMDMTPMIDVVFQLMIFFMCTIKFKTLEGKLTAYLPKDVGVNTDAGVVPEEELSYQASMAIRLGLDEEVALRGITINGARAVGIEKRVGSLEEGRWADLVLWKPAFFGIKPSLVLKGGFIAAAAMGDPNASIPTPQPVHYRPMFGAFGGALHRGSLTFMSQAAVSEGLPEALGLRKRVAAVKGCRDIKKQHMVHNSALPVMEVDAQTYQVRADGVLLTCEPATVLPMAQRYFLF